MNSLIELCTGGYLTDGSYDHIDDNVVPKFEELPEMQRSHDKEDDHSDYCTNKRRDVPIHLPVKSWTARWVCHFDVRTVPNTKTLLTICMLIKSKDDRFEKQ